MFDIVFFLSFTLRHLLLCCIVLGLVLFYLAIQLMAARVFFKSVQPHPFAIHHRTSDRRVLLPLCQLSSVGHLWHKCTN